MMTTQLLQQLQRRVPPPETASYLLAVSGGLDSSVMAYMFHELQLNFAIAHCNFHLRGEDSNQDAAFVRGLAELYQVPLFTTDFDTLKVKKEMGTSMEMTARTLRYDWFNNIATDFDFIVTAHHANDAAETLLLNLIRGTGLKGLTSIPEQNGKIIRPMLSFTRREIEQYAANNNILFCVDKSNTDNDISRNLIRNKIIPVLETINPSLIETITQNISNFSKIYKYYNKYLYKTIGEIAIINDGVYHIDLNKLKNNEHVSILLFEILNPWGFSGSQCRQIEQSLEGQSGKTFYSDTHMLIKDRQLLIVQKREKEFENQKKEVEIQIINSYEELLALGFQVKFMQNSAKFEFERDNNMLYIDADTIKFPLSLRHWQSGDYFYPFGMTQRKKLSDFFQSIKLNLLEKQNVQLLCSGDDIIWIVGYRGDNRFRVTQDTKEIITIRC